MADTLVHVVTEESLDYFWTHPVEGNEPEDYLRRGAERSQFLVQLVQTLDPQPKRILEVGCGPGRNLLALLDAGYGRLHGIDINPGSELAMQRHLPLLHKHCTYYIGKAQDILPKLPSSAYGLTFTMAFLQHLSAESFELVAREMIRVTQHHLIVIEDMTTHSPIHYIHDYSAFTKELELVRGAASLPGFEPGYVCQVYRKR